MEFFENFVAPIILGLCLCVGYIIKNVIPSDKINKFIPLIMGALGVAISCWMTLSLTPETILTGLFSGLASTGMYEAFHGIINK